MCSPKQIPRFLCTFYPTVHTFGMVLLTHTLLVHTHTWRFRPQYEKCELHQINKSVLLYSQKSSLQVVSSGHLNSPILSAQGISNLKHN